MDPEEDFMRSESSKLRSDLNERGLGLVAIGKSCESIIQGGVSLDGW